MRKAILGILFLMLYFGVSTAIYFASAGRTDFPLGWAYFLINLGTGVIFSIVLEIVNPGLIAERFKPGPGEQDRVFKIGSSILTVLMLVVAGLDVGRYHWTGPVAPWLQIAALVFVFLGYLFMAWATLANRFFSSAVRLQTDRGQVVVDSGPYQFVRHPGYTGAIPYLVFGGLALGSWLATVIAGVPMIVILLRRTVLEDKMLLQGLAGYKEYAARVKYRLAPGIW
jgi:protein-S-isoprenylcysteine O-methyltransferase Ste14